MIYGTKSKNIPSFVYKWIKSKTFVEVPHLIVDSHGNILFNPVEALEEFNEQWDKVFASNVLHQEPLGLLKFVWPYIDEIRSEAELPVLNGHMLRQQILGRKPNAAAGIDGWRTVETQCLPIFVLDQIGSFFRGIEDGARQMPKQFATAKQVLLNAKWTRQPDAEENRIPASDFLVSVYRLKIQATTSMAKQNVSLRIERWHQGQDHE